MVSTSYPSDLSDWRGLFIRHLTDAMGCRSDTRMALWAPAGEIHPEVIQAATPREAAWLSEMTAAGGIAHLLRAGGVGAVKGSITLITYLYRAYRRLSGTSDIYHINWLQNALPLPHDGKPVLIAVLGTDMQLLRMPLMATLLRAVCRGRRVVVCPNAGWMVPILRQSFGRHATVQEVPFGIDPCWYALERERSNKPTWLVVSRLTRPKLGPLFEWCQPLFEGAERQLHLFGPMQETLPIPRWVHYHGPVTPLELSQTWFPRACGLITASRHPEGRPQVMLEAMAAGLPIIASSLPAHRNLIVHGKTGWLCDSPTEFSKGVEVLEEDVENARIGLAARRWVRSAVGTWDDCAARYHDLYVKLVRS